MIHLAAIKTLWWGLNDLKRKKFRCPVALELTLAEVEISKGPELESTNFGPFQSIHRELKYLAFDPSNFGRILE